MPTTDLTDLAPFHAALDPGVIVTDADVIETYVVDQRDLLRGATPPPMHHPDTAETIGFVFGKPMPGTQRQNSGMSEMSPPAE